MKKISVGAILPLAVALFLIGCGGGDTWTGSATTDSKSTTSTSTSTSTTSTSTTSTSTTTTAVAAAISLFGSASLPSASGSSVTLTAIVKDANNVALASQPVSFQATSGVIMPSGPSTDATGTITAVLNSGGDPTVRTITVTATSGTVSSTFNVYVTGTKVSVSGPTSITSAPSTFTITIKDSSGAPVVGQYLSSVAAASTGDTISYPSGTTLNTSGLPATDSNGQVNFSLTSVSTSGTDTITVSGLGATANYPVTVSNSSLTVSAPSSINIGTCTPISATWLPASSGQTVNFYATRGNFFTDSSCGTSATSALTNSGVASLYIESASSGPSSITVITSGPSATSSTNFVANTPASMTLSATTTTVSPGGSTPITAVVSDANGNLVQGATVSFTISGNDPTGSSISPPGVAVTDSMGRATITFTGGSNSGNVQVAAAIANTSITQPLTLTVGQQALSINMGLANVISADSSGAAYLWNGIVQVSDVAGNPVSNVTVNMTMYPTYYDKGARIWSGTWAATSTITSAMTALPGYPQYLPCPNEDLYTGNAPNGHLDPGEDYNNDNQLETGFVGTIFNTASGSTGGSTVSLTTDSTGSATFTIKYAKDYASWTQIRVTAAAGVSGSNASQSMDVVLPALASDLSNQGAAPPGELSKWGITSSCLTPN